MAAARQARVLPVSDLAVREGTVHARVLLVATDPRGGTRLGLPHAMRCKCCRGQGRRPDHSAWPQGVHERGARQWVVGRALGLGGTAVGRGRSVVASMMAIASRTTTAVRARSTPSDEPRKPMSGGPARNAQ
jgi:hypothetical protein